MEQSRQDSRTPAEPEFPVKPQIPDQGPGSENHKADWENHSQDSFKVGKKCSGASISLRLVQPLPFQSSTLMADRVLHFETGEGQPKKWTVLSHHG